MILPIGFNPLKRKKLRVAIFLFSELYFFRKLLLVKKIKSS